MFKFSLSITPYHTDMVLTTAGLVIKNGVVDCNGLVRPSTSSHVATVSVQLQQKINGSWHQIASWSDTAAAGSTAMDS